jgi:hypothetical protein
MTQPDDQNARATPPANADGHSDETVEPALIEFGANERRYRQIWRQGMVAILEARNHGDVIVSYEVVIIQIQSARERFGKWYGPKEAYPSNEDFGRKGWALPTRDIADQWAAIVLDNVGKSAKERPSWAELLHDFSERIRARDAHHVGDQASAERADQR